MSLKKYISTKVHFRKIVDLLVMPTEIGVIGFYTDTL